MARKPRSQWSPSYRRRVERAEARGMSRQAARGHARREHVTRKLAAGLTPAQSAAINKFARAQALKSDGADPDQASVVLKQWARDKGYDRFLELRERQRELAADYKSGRIEHRGGKSKKAVAHISTVDIGADFEFFDLPAMPDGDDFAWFFYHP